MNLVDRIMIGGLIVACVILAVAFQSLGRHVADLDDQRVPTTIVREQPPTTPPTFNMDGERICAPGDGVDTNWAARMGVPDQPRCA